MGWGETATYLGFPASHRDGNLDQIISGHLPVLGTVSVAAQRLAERLGTTPEEVAALLDQGAGYGTVVVHYKLAGEFEGITPEQLVEKRVAGWGWGQIRRELSVDAATTTESQDEPLDHPGPNYNVGAPDHAGPKDHNKHSK